MSIRIGTLGLVFFSALLTSLWQLGFSVVPESASLTLLGLGLVFVARSFQPAVYRGFHEGAVAAETVLISSASIGSPSSR